METKRCSKCGEVKAVDCFSKDRRSTDGKRAACKRCLHLTDAQYRATNAVEIKIRRNIWRENNKGREASMLKKWRSEHPDAMREIRARWYRKNREKCYEYSAAFLRKHPAITRQRTIRRTTLLPDSYVAWGIARRVSCAPSSIPPELIEAKRAHLQMVRMLKKEKQK